MQFTLGGYAYNAPNKIGAGVRARVMESQFGEVLKSEFSSKLIDAGMKALEATGEKKYQGAPKDELKKRVVEEHYTSILSVFTTAHPRASTLAILQSVLTPVEGSPSVEEGYDEAEESEVNAVLSFFTESARAKTEGVPSKPASGKATAKVPASP